MTAQDTAHEGAPLSATVLGSTGFSDPDHEGLKDRSLGVACP
jgi:hypothetical protein